MLGVRSQRIGLALLAALATVAGPSRLGLAFVFDLPPLNMVPAEPKALILIFASIVLLLLLRRWIPRLDHADERYLAIGFAAGGAIWLAVIVLGLVPDVGRDAFVFFDHRLPDPYTTPYADYGFGYSPVFAQLVYPFLLLPWPVFLGLWSGLLLRILWRLAGPYSPGLLLVPVVGLDIRFANVNLLLALAMVIGLTRPWAWTLVLLTKITPGVALVWFAARREWPKLCIALAATIALVVPSYLLAPGLWHEWTSVLVDAGGSQVGSLNGPLPLRLGLALAIGAVGARTSRAWTIPVAGVVALPVVFPAALSILVAVIPLSRRASTRELRADDRHSGQTTRAWTWR